MIKIDIKLSEEQSPQADFNSPIPSLMMGACKDFARRARSPLRHIHFARVRILAEHFYRIGDEVSYTIKNHPVKTLATCFDGMTFLIIS